ncbi:FUSC family protein [Micromonospora sp. DPT]|uniref:FUSC family protein n=1 Tax=Micromonospora sp. DPT TaxID=3142975 RepID=UPI0032097016
MARVLSPRGALALQKVDGALLFALRAALAMALPALPLVLAGRAGLAVYTMLGAFITTFGRNLPYSRRARILASAGLAMTACVGCGAALAVVARPQAGGTGAAVVVAATAAVAGLAKFTCDATRLGGLGAVLLLFAFAVAANGSPTPTDVLLQTELALAGAATAWVLAMVGRYVHPDRPQRLAVATALHELAALLDLTDSGDTTGRARRRATAGVLHAYHSLGVAPPTATDRANRDGTCVRLTDLSWSMLISSTHRSSNRPTSMTRHLRRQARLLTTRRRQLPPVLPELLASSAAARAGVVHGLAGIPAAQADPTAQRATELVVGHQLGGPLSNSALVVPALRMILGTGAAGGLAVLLNLGHGYWAAISAAAVLHSINVRTSAQRAIQRTLGTLVGLVLALGVLAVHPVPAVLVLVIVLLESLLEYVVARNYGLGVVFLTPVALLLVDLASPTPVEDLVYDRGLASALGITIGLVCALLVVHDHSAVRAERALAACTQAAERAERALAGGAGTSLSVAQAQLAAAVVELHDADDAAAGELWSAGIDPTVLAAAEQRAYSLLNRLLRHQ